jgi:hypothetical protein
MSVVVLLAVDQPAEVVKNGKTWTVDVDGHLFIYDEDAQGPPVATFARNQWVGVKA